MIFRRNNCLKNKKKNFFNWILLNQVFKEAFFYNNFKGIINMIEKSNKSDSLSINHLIHYFILYIIINLKLLEKNALENLNEHNAIK